MTLGNMRANGVGTLCHHSAILDVVTPVPGQRLIQLTQQHFRRLDERGNDRLRVLMLTFNRPSFNR